MLTGCPKRSHSFPSLSWGLAADCGHRAEERRATRECEPRRSTWEADWKCWGGEPATESQCGRDFRIRGELESSLPCPREANFQTSGISPPKGRDICAGGFRKKGRKHHRPDDKFGSEGESSFGPTGNSRESLYPRGRHSPAPPAPVGGAIA